MRIDWWTLTLQAINFLVLVWLLQHFLYRPVQGIIAERQQQADRVLAEADAARTAAEALRATLDEQRTAIDQERHQALERAHATAKAEAEGLLGRARTDAERLLAKERRRIEQERVEVVDALRLQAIDIGVAVARRLLADAGDTGLDGVFLERALTRLQALSEAERSALVDGLARGSAVRVVTAAPLDRAGRGDFIGRLRTLLGTDVNVEFATDPTLLAGAEVHFPHMVLHHNWRDSLGEIEEDLKRDDRPQGLA